MAESADSKLTPPYIPYATLKSFIESLHNTALPPVIDKSLMATLSGAVKSHLMNTMKFLGLIDQTGRVATKFESLFAAFGNADAWKDALKAVVVEAYKPIIGEHDISRITDKQLDDAFRAVSSLEGTMLERATRFYIQAMTDARASVSPHLLNRKKRSPKKPGQKASKVNGDATPAKTEKPEVGKPAEKPADTDQPPVGTISFPLYFKGKKPGMIRVPEILDDDDVKSIELTVQVIKAYAAQKAGV